MNETSFDELSNSSYCDQFDNQLALETADKCSLVLEGIWMPLIGTLGLLGNLLTITVLSSKDMNNSFNKLIRALAVFDSIFIIFVTFEYTFVRVWGWPITEGSIIYVFIFPKVIYPLNDICLCCSIYTTIAVSYERFSAVCNPYQYREKNIKNINKSFVKVLSLIICASVAINIPRFFETKIVSEDVGGTNNSRHDNNGSALETWSQTSYTYEVTPLRIDPNYIRFYINGTRLLCTCALPLVCLVILNFKIHRGIRFSHCRQRQSVKREINLAFIIFCIVCVFFGCNITRIILNCYEVIMTSDLIKCGASFTPPTWFLCLTSFNHFSLVLNASVNFLVYLVLGRKFRKKAKEMLSNLFGITMCTSSKEKPSITSANLEQNSASQEEPTSTPQEKILRTFV